MEQRLTAISSPSKDDCSDGFSARAPARVFECRLSWSEILTLSVTDLPSFQIIWTDFLQDGWRKSCQEEERKVTEVGLYFVIQLFSYICRWSSIRDVTVNNINLNSRYVLTVFEFLVHPGYSWASPENSISAQHCTVCMRVHPPSTAQYGSVPAMQCTVWLSTSSLG